ncbi:MULTISPECIES: DUF58 domain-containing protein [unclassified Oceanispirochaeta]|uniref:DUF58 domain-containing protein n=1 Tax=unclassified Oceanispirochaeta TaxID=2635722 RepID=UPI000E099875|nr:MULTISPECIES: DUF58 domain-containing protein [unclassified Oceanispirochaeta]MBF9018426.1 DUF58 domain-containing protein [Oceanispirochaeta sp. M2]NPD74857.1 DUF58 domain-containing protein [Oceanispirochaeta sp. M1]RDG29298.1 DUF58 domain-containing protein [Oceanispirochaeta sp. M1]
MIDPELAARLERIRVLTRRKITAAFAGDYISAFKGRGMEFEEVRPYQPGDEVKFIDWNVTARSSEPYVKVYREERELSMMLLLDLSPSGLFSSQEKSKNQLAAELCAMLAYTAVSNQDKVGLTIFTDHVEKVIPPARGNRHVMHLIRDVISYKPEGKGTSISSALKYTNSILRKKSILFLISDFHDQGYENHLAAAAEKHDLVCIQLLDPREEIAPDRGLYRFVDPESGRTRLYDGRSPQARKEWEKLYHGRQKALKSMIREKGGDFLTLHAGEDWVQPLTRFFMQRGGLV